MKVILLVNLYSIYLLYPCSKCSSCPQNVLYTRFFFDLIYSSNMAIWFTDLILWVSSSPARTNFPLLVWRLQVLLRSQPGAPVPLTPRWPYMLLVVSLGSTSFGLSSLFHSFLCLTFSLPPHPLFSLTYHNAHRLICPYPLERLREHKGIQS